MSNQKTAQSPSTSGLWQTILAIGGLIAVWLLSCSAAWALIVPATKDLTCAGARTGNLNCTAGEFTVAPVFSAAAGTPPFCVAGQPFNFQVELGLSGTNTDRYDIGFFVGQEGNDPRAATAGNICSVATFPKKTLLEVTPWKDSDGNACGDYTGGGNYTQTVNEIKVVCAGNTTTGELQMPYVITYKQNTTGICTGPTDVTNGAPSKCNSGTGVVSGTTAVRVGAYVDVTKKTNPTGSSQAFSFTATGPTGSKLIAMVGSTYTPASISAASNTVTISITDGQTARIYIDTTTAEKTVTITETLVTGWEPTAAISCTAVTGSPPLTTNNGTRTVTAGLSIANSAAACTVTNTKRPTLTLTKVSQGGTGTFTFTGSNGWTNQNITTTTVDVGVAGALQTLTLSNTATTITETPPAGFAMTGVSCTGMGSGGSVTPNLAVGTFTLDTSATAAGSDIVCTVTNAKIPTVKIQKTTIDGVGGPFNFTQTNLVSSPANITTTVAATATPSSPIAINVTATGTAVTLTETPATGFSLTTANCTDANSSVTGNVGVIGTISGNILTIPAINVKAGADFTCTFNNLKTTTLQLAKVWGTNSSASDSATVGATTGGSANTSAFTTAGGTAANSGAVNITVGNTITFPAETGTNIGNYNTVLSCLANGGATANALSGTNGQVSNTLLIGATDAGKALVCTYTNTPKTATIQLAKAWGSNSSASDSATVGATTGGSANTTAFTTAGGTAANSGTAVTITVGNTITFPAETGTNIGNYNTVLNCLANGGATANALSGTNGQVSNTLLIGAADSGKALVCTYTNTPKTSTIQLAKAWAANSSASDSATVGATTGGSANTSAFTTAGGTAANSGAAATITVGNTITFPAETGTNIGNYNTVLSCLADGGATANSLSGTNGQNSNTLLIGAADSGKALVCTYTNTRKSTTFRLAKAWGANSTAGNVANLGATTGLINNTAAFNSTASTATNGVAVTVFAGETATLPAETMSVGTLANYNTVVSCNAGTLTGTNGQSVGNTLAITAASTVTNPITCTYTNTPILAVTITGRVFNDNSGTTGSASAAYNGTQDSGEVGIQGSQVALTNCSSTVVATSTTNAGGDYSFSVQPAQLPTPNFCVVETNVSGYTSVSGTSGYTRATDTITISNSDATSYSNHNFGDARLNVVLTEDGQQTIIAGGVADYPHRLTAQSVLTVTSLGQNSTQPPANATDAPWQSLLYLDTDCNGKVDAGENLISASLPLSLKANEQVCLVQRVYAPATASMGAQHIGQLQASFNVSLANPTDTITGSSIKRQDTTLLGSAGLSMQKMVRSVESCPSTAEDTGAFATTNTAQSGGYLEYEITYRNNSLKNLIDISIKDTVPVGTVFKNINCQVSPAGTCTESKTGDALLWQTSGTLLPNQQGKVRFCVQIP